MTNGEFRSDIEGLRAISILVVVLYHAKVPLFVGGFVGVDVFFVISGFLITGLLLREMERYQSIDLFAFWARRARRLLPNALLVLASTLLFAAAVFPFTLRAATANDVFAALLYFSNYHFAERAVDYFDHQVQASPVLHFWSLSVEEQFYIGWPLLLVGLAWLYGTHANRRARWALSIIACTSFSLSLFWVLKSQPNAFFHTEARIWQLSVGALLAAAYGRIVQLSPIVHLVLAWLGLGGIVASVVMLDETLGYPGLWALVPSISTAAVVAGGNAGKLSPKIILALAPLQWLGRRSYSLYLWHWPLIIFMPYALPGLPNSSLIAVALALPVAATTFTFLEDPIRRQAQVDANHGRTLAFAAAGCVIICLASIVLLHLSLLGSTRQAELAQRISGAKADGPRMVGGKCESGWVGKDENSCRFGSLNATEVVVLFGDSHAEHLFDGLYEATISTNRVLWLLTKAACPPIEVAMYSARLRGPDRECWDWREKAVRRLLVERPSLVLISSWTGVAEKLWDANTGQRRDRRESLSVWKQGFFNFLQRLNQAGLNVVVVRDTPRSRRDNVLDCLAQSGDNACGSPRQEAADWGMPDVEVARRIPKIGVLDLTDHFCSAHVCAAVKDGIIMYRDNTHLTASFSKTLAPEFQKILVGAQR